MPADWALGSMVLAIIPILAISFKRELWRIVIAKCLQWLCFESAYCDSVVWDRLDGGSPFHSHRHCSPNAPGREQFSTLLDTHNTEDFLQYFSELAIHKSEKPVKKPLGLDLTRKYFHTDVKTLLMCWMSTIDIHVRKTWQYHYDPRSDSYKFTLDKSFLNLKRRSNYFEGTICAPCYDCDIVTRRTKTELEHIIILGSPPWYREKLKNIHDVEFRFPETNNRNMARAGWIIAVGIGDADALPYFATSFGDFEPFGYRHHRGPGSGSYWKGCQYLRKFVCSQIGKAFPQNELVHVTNRAIKGMLKEHTGSITSGLLSSTPLEDAFLDGKYTERLRRDDIEFAINIFNSPQLEESDIRRLEEILLPVLAGAIRGLHEVLQHLNTHSFQLRGNFNVLALQDLPVFLAY